MLYTPFCVYSICIYNKFWAWSIEQKNKSVCTFGTYL
jgi:hypothetical protein